MSEYIEKHIIYDDVNRPYNQSVWTKGDGERIRVVDMTDDHLLNCIRHQQLMVGGIALELILEANRRGLMLQVERRYVEEDQLQRERMYERQRLRDRYFTETQQ